MSAVGVSIRGIPEAQEAMVKAARAVSAKGGLQKAVKAATLHLQQYAVSITHVDTGALRASHVPEVRGTRGLIYPNPTAVRSDGKKPADYGIYEHRRGGAHAFYARTIAESGKAARDAGLKVIVREMYRK